MVRKLLLLLFVIITTIIFINHYIPASTSDNTHDTYLQVLYDYYYSY